MDGIEKVAKSFGEASAHPAAQPFSPVTNTRAIAVPAVCMPPSWRYDDPDATCNSKLQVLGSARA
jgi:hypothetical protein